MQRTRQIRSICSVEEMALSKTTVLYGGEQFMRDGVLFCLNGIRVCFSRSILNFKAFLQVVCKLTRSLLPFMSPSR